MTNPDELVTPTQVFNYRERQLEVSEFRPALMGIVNCTPDSFSDSRVLKTITERVEFAHSLVQAGADLIDVGGESGVVHHDAVSVKEEIDRVVPVVRKLVDDGVTVSVDTWKPGVAEAVLDAGAQIINDVSALYDPKLIDVVAKYRAGIVLMHTAGPPKQECFPVFESGVLQAVKDTLGSLISTALQSGVEKDSIIVDPGPDFTKTPAESVELMRSLAQIEELGFPVLLAISRKYFIGAALDREPDERLAGTLATLGWCSDRCRYGIARIHDVKEANDFLMMREMLSGRQEMPEFRRDDKRLQWLHDDRKQ